MAREVSITIWCDRHMAKGEHLPAAEYAGLSTVGVKVLVDLCEECADEVLKPALTVLDRFGREQVKSKKKIAPTSSTTPRSGDVPCPSCDRHFTTNQGLAMHRHHAHKEELEAKAS